MEMESTQLMAEQVMRAFDCVHIERYEKLLGAHVFYLGHNEVMVIMGSTDCCAWMDLEHIDFQPVTCEADMAKYRVVPWSQREECGSTECTTPGLQFTVVEGNNGYYSPSLDILRGDEARAVVHLLRMAEHRGWCKSSDYESLLLGVVDSSLLARMNLYCKYNIRFDLRKVSLADVHIPGSRSGLTPREPGEDGILGVLHRKEGCSAWHVVDGRHRTLWALEQGMKTGTYVIAYGKGE